MKDCIQLARWHDRTVEPRRQISNQAIDLSIRKETPRRGSISGRRFLSLSLLQHNLLDILLLGKTQLADPLLAQLEKLAEAHYLSLCFDQVLLNLVSLRNLPLEHVIVGSKVTGTLSAKALSALLRDVAINRTLRSITQTGLTRTHFDTRAFSDSAGSSAQSVQRRKLVEVLGHDEGKLGGPS